VEREHHCNCKTRCQTYRCNCLKNNEPCDEHWLHRLSESAEWGRCRQPIRLRDPEHPSVQGSHGQRVGDGLRTALWTREHTAQSTIGQVSMPGMRGGLLVFLLLE
jgi:hypothetical protein